ncbi:MAG: SMC-Scp complex subunit ScpB [Clostridia bacterium]|nr:SMC-Scp complex subunit ScpB [Clostridia bacterium]
MEKLTNIIEAILFASGKSVALDDIAEKLGVTVGEVRRSLAELKQKYNEESGIQVLEFNRKAQLASNPVYKDGVAAVLNPIREKELTRTILECAAIIAYKQPITRTEIELLRGLNSDYAVNALLELNLIYRCGRKDAVGHPVLFATTDEFLKRFKLKSLEDLPDYDTLMAAITRSDEDRDNYLYAREEYKDPSENPSQEKKPAQTPKKTPEKEDSDVQVSEESEETDDGGYEIPDFLRGLDDMDIVKIS